MPPAGFDLAIPANEKSKVHALDRPTAWMGVFKCTCVKTIYFVSKTKFTTNIYLLNVAV